MIKRGRPSRPVIEAILDPPGSQIPRFLLLVAKKPLLQLLHRTAFHLRAQRKKIPLVEPPKQILQQLTICLQAQHKDNHMIAVIRNNQKQIYLPMLKEEEVYSLSNLRLSQALSSTDRQILISPSTFPTKQKMRRGRTLPSFPYTNLKCNLLLLSRLGREC